MWSRLWAYIRSREGVLFVSTLIVGGILSHLFFTSVLLAWITRQGREYVLPLLVGKSLPAVQSSLERAGFRVIVIDSQYVPDKPPLTVLLQDPPANTKVKKGRKVYLTIAACKPPEIPFPQIQDMPYEEAYRLLRETYGFRIEGVEYVAGRDPDVIVGAKYKGKRIAPGTMTPKYASIELIVSRGLSDQKVPFISVVGLPLEEAVARLHAMGLSIGHIRYKPIPSLPLGQVYRQYPERVATDSVPAGTAIDLVVNSQPPSSLTE
ncbi:MAG: PASTA domain-containing protein [Bacteroidia bacterium]|nr:PASTA domain-containing protein [Bacteroidia bacterium]MDW8016123.1 PASTA domain-containing protein [Bacteroidia bacterium]